MTVTAPYTRLPRLGGPRRRGAEVLRGVLALVALLALLAGVPALLATAVGWPLPTTAPTRDWLTAAIDGQVLIDVFACAVWLAWSYFAVCMGVELRADRRRALAPHLPLAGGGQVLARRLIGAVLLMVSAAVVVAPAAQAASNGLPQPRAAVSQSAPLSAPAATAATNATGGGGGARADTVPAGQRSGAQTSAITKLYEVHPREGRHYECLWDIAEKYLGSGLRYKELVALNAGRTQPDGRTLGNPDLIHPGWVLVMPADATGPGLRVVDTVTAPAGTRATPTPTSDAAPAAQAASTADADHAADSPDRAGAGAVSIADEAPDSSLALPFGVAGAALAAGLLVALQRRRGPLGGPDGADGEAEVDLRLAADLPLARRLDHALRDLSARLTAAGQRLPAVYAAFLQDGAITLALSPAVPLAPEPWTVDSDDRTWTLAGSAVLTPREQLSAVAAPYPALVTFGTRADGATVLVDLDAAGGVVSLGGADGPAREVAASVAVELATNLWSDDVDVRLVGFGDDLTAVAPDRITRQDRLEPALEAIERDTAQHRVLTADGLSSVLRGRQLRADDRLWRPTILILSATPSEQEAARLAQLASDPGRAVGVLVVGDVPDARWRFVVGADGALHASALGLDVTAQRLSREQYVPVVALLAAADAAGQGGEQESRTVGGALALAAGRQPLQDERMADPSVPFPVEVRVLGPVEVRGPGSIDPARAELATEIVALAALHPEGVHPHVLGSAVWPRGASDAVQQAAIGHVQHWLGQDNSGQPRLHLRVDGRWHLSDDVRVDWRVAQALACRATGATEADDLAAALTFVRGAAWAHLPAGRYAWLAHGSTERDSRALVVAAASRLAELASAGGDQTLACDALCSGLRMVPTSELLWRDLLRLEHSRGGREAAVHVAQGLYAELRAHGVPGGASAETDALVDELLPGLRSTAA